MNFKKPTNQKLVVSSYFRQQQALTKLTAITVFLVSSMLLCGLASAGAYEAEDNNSAASVIELKFGDAHAYLSGDGNLTDISEISVSAYPQTYHLNVTEADRKILLMADITGKSERVIELISPNGITARSYILSEDGFSEESSPEYLYSQNNLLMLTDVAELGLWTLKIDRNDNNDGSLFLSAMLIEKNNFRFAAGKHEDKPAQITGNLSETALANKSAAKDNGKIYDYYKTYDEALSDIENGYIFNMTKSFTTAAIPTVTNGEKNSFYVHHNNVMDISVSMNNLFQYTDANESWVKYRDSFIKFEVFDPTGKTAFSFIKNANGIEEAIDLSSSLTLYPGEWKYQVSFAYATDGKNESNLKINAKYRNIYEEDLQWLIDNKLQ